MNDEILYENIRKIISSKRIQYGLDKKELSLKCELDPTYIGKFERGQLEPTIKTLVKIAVVLGISPKDLMPE